MIELVKARKVRALEGARLEIEFSDGTGGVADLGEFLKTGPMMEPLRDPSFFARVFLEMGVPTWPNGCDIDPTALRMQMKEKGQIERRHGHAAGVREEIVHIKKIRRLGNYRLKLWFTDGQAGEWDFSELAGEHGPMAEPFKDPAYFDRVFLEMGGLAWPNGFDWSPEALYADMDAAGALSFEADSV